LKVPANASQPIALLIIWLSLKAYTRRWWVKIDNDWGRFNDVINDFERNLYLRDDPVADDSESLAEVNGGVQRGPVELVVTGLASSLSEG
jgi:hypothetical protein